MTTKPARRLAAGDVFDTPSLAPQQIKIIEERTSKLVRLVTMQGTKMTFGADQQIRVLA
jgi:hypothetical protein